MKTPKCANCGEQMLETYMRNGARIYLCPHVKMNIVRDKSDKIVSGHIYCAINIDGLRASFSALTQNKITIEQLRKATRKTVDDATLYEYANLAVTLGLPVKRLPELFDASVTLSYALGKDAEYGIKSLVIGIGRRSWMVMDNIGILVRQQWANAWFEQKYGHKPKTDEEKTNAWREYAISKVMEKAKMLQRKTVEVTAK